MLAIGMKVIDAFDDRGKVTSFEVSNVFLRRRDVCRIFERIPDIVRVKKNLRQDEFCEYNLNGVHFVAEEPFGDNDVYWVGPIPKGWVPEVDIVRKSFLDFSLNVWGVLPWVILAALVIYMLVSVCATRC
jgi:hypothetical protein